MAERRHNLRRLVNRYGLLTTELGKSDEDIARLVRASNAALGAFADEDENLSAAVARLPGTLRQTERDPRQGRAARRPHGPDLRGAAPAVPQARRGERPRSARSPRRPRRCCVTQVRPFARAASRSSAISAPPPRELAAAGPDMTKAFRGLNRLFNIGAYNPGGREGISRSLRARGRLHARRARAQRGLPLLARLGRQNNTTSLFSTADALGPIRRAYLLGLNCDVSTGADAAGIPAAEAERLVDLLGGIGACAKP